MDELGAKLKAVLRPAVARARSLPAGPERGFWAFQPENDFPPRSIRTPEEYDGSDRLCIVCTPTRLPSRDRTDPVTRWCEFLRAVDGVRYLWFLSKVPQRLFEAACRVRGLAGLYVKSSGIDSLEPLRAATQLLHLRLGGSPAVSDLAPVSGLLQLRWLELDNLKDVVDLDQLGNLANLEGLGFTGAEGRRHTLASFAPLAKLAALRWLHLGSLQASDQSLRALSALDNLRWLGVGNFFPWQEFAWLAGQLPHTACTWFSPGRDLGHLGIRCKQCGGAIHMMSGKPVSKLCPACDAQEFTAFVAKFTALKARSEAARKS